MVEELISKEKVHMIVQVHVHVYTVRRGLINH